VIRAAVIRAAVIRAAVIRALIMGRVLVARVLVVRAHRTEEILVLRAEEKGNARRPPAPRRLPSEDMSNERLPVSGADLDDLDVARLDGFLAARAPALVAASSREDVAIRLGLLARSAPRVVPTVTGLYVFGKIPQLQHPEWGVTCIASAGATLLEPVRARVDLDGGLPALVDGAMAFLAERCGGGDDAEYSLPLVREVVVNALVHRDLRRPSRVAVRLFVDRLEVWSPGGPPEGSADLDEQSREGGVSNPRNPLVASIARALGYGEQLGRGLHAVLHRGGASLDQRPELRVTPRDVLVLLPSHWQRPRAAEQLS
jgi:ATP-dependent DNA helicase RecG